MPFTEALLTKLPPELRDYVYSYLLSDMEPRILITSFRLKHNPPLWDPERKSVPRMFTPAHHGKSPFHVIPAIINAEVFRELLRMYYQRITFVLRETPKDWRITRRCSGVTLSQFLQKNSFGAGIVSANICRLEIRLSDLRWYSEVDTLPVEDSAKERIRTHLVTQRYASLKEIRTKCSVQFLIKIYGQHVTKEIQIWRNWSAALVPTLLMLEETACVVGLKVISYWNGRARCKAVHRSWDITGSSTGQSVAQRLEELLKVRSVEALL